MSNKMSSSLILRLCSKHIWNEGEILGYVKPGRYNEACMNNNVTEDTIYHRNVLTVNDAFNIPVIFRLPIIQTIS